MQQSQAYAVHEDGSPVADFMMDAYGEIWWRTDAGVWTDGTLTGLWDWVERTWGRMRAVP